MRRQGGELIAGHDGGHVRQVVGAEQLGAPDDEHQVGLESQDVGEPVGDVAAVAGPDEEIRAGGGSGGAGADEVRVRAEQVDELDDVVPVGDGGHVEHESVRRAGRGAAIEYGVSALGVMTSLNAESSVAAVPCISLSGPRYDGSDGTRNVANP